MSQNTVAVVTGGAGGMGLATARLLGRDHQVLISDVGGERLSEALATLRAEGVSAEALECDITDRRAVQALAQRAADLGQVVAVVHAAGISPQMAGPEAILRVNALGTIHVVESFQRLLSDGAALVLVASMAAHLTPRALLPTRAYRHAATDPERMLSQVLRRIGMMPQAQRSGMAYSVSKNFVVWYSKHAAPGFGRAGARILSVSPGSFDTAMGRLEEDSGAGAMLRYAALPRFGKVEEVAEVLAFCAGPKPGYLTGTDILVDGGVVAGIGWRDLLRAGR